MTVTRILALGGSLKCSEGPLSPLLAHLALFGLLLAHLGAIFGHSGGQFPAISSRFQSIRAVT